MNLSPFFSAAKAASKKTARLLSLQKTEILLTIAEKLKSSSAEIVAENAKDITEGERKNLGSMLDRLLLTPDRILAMAQDVQKVAHLHDFVGEIIAEETRPNGLGIQKVRVPMGVIAMIYESRPNVTVDAAVLALKSGNAILLKGGKEAAFSNRVLVKIMREVLADYGIEDAVQLLDNATREDTEALLKAKGKIDLLIPRGGKGLIDFVTQNAQVPVIETGASVVHTFVDASANLEMAKNIIINEKTRRVSVCNALDTLLVHEDIAEKLLPILIPELEKFGVETHCNASLRETQNFASLQEHDFDTEWLDYKMSLRIVKDLDEALDHIEAHSLGHSESIITENPENADRFLREVDSACVYHNSSTAFSDGGEFGLGAEMGISTQKLHARGPFALEALTSTKWVVRGKGQVRG
ncbi:MAG: glutamate-5-semialdehyde dehydrogenase [Candidatus Peregrinibacteria bacterium]